MNSEMFKLNMTNLVRGATNAVVAGVAFTLLGIMGNGFDVFTADWAMIFNTAVNAAVAALVGYLGTKFFSDSEGKFMGHIG